VKDVPSRTDVVECEEEDTSRPPEEEAVFIADRRRVSVNNFSEEKVPLLA
jgi:hypothetical protein